MVTQAFPYQAFFSFFKIAQEVTQLLAITAEKKGVTLKLTINSFIPNILIGDPTRLKQILFNLVGNAVKFTERGQVTLHLDGQYDGEGKDKSIYTLIGTIQDTGIGMSPLTQKRIFNPFSQADESTSRRFGGTGLGLTITKKFCELMGGDVDILKTGQDGSTFQFKVCLKLPEGVNKRAITLPKEIPDKLPPLQILLAEDNEVNQLFLRVLLEKSGA